MTCAKVRWCRASDCGIIIGPYHQHRTLESNICSYIIAIILFGLFFAQKVTEKAYIFRPSVKYASVLHNNIISPVVQVYRCVTFLTFLNPCLTDKMPSTFSVFVWTLLNVHLVSGICIILIFNLFFDHVLLTEFMKKKC